MTKKLYDFRRKHPFSQLGEFRFAVGTPEFEQWARDVEKRLKKLEKKP